ncbi:MAG: hypothetical protein M0019_04580 [Actinomycetota bacterium]|nr:hypothetical protein [Actinomycetota bacterium]
MLDSRFTPVAFEGLFITLSRKVIHQQLSTKVALVIEDRLSQECGGSIEPSRFLSLDSDSLARIGLSRSKVRAITELASIFEASPDSMREILEFDDAKVIARITSLYGFGNWSAQMFLLFDMGRKDIWAPLDLGVRKGYQRLKHLSEVPSYENLKDLDKVYSPMGSMATWYLWRALELP